MSRIILLIGALLGLVYGIFKFIERINEKEEIPAANQIPA